MLLSLYGLQAAALIVARYPIMSDWRLLIVCVSVAATLIACGGPGTESPPGPAAAQAPPEAAPEEPHVEEPVAEATQDDLPGQGEPAVEGGTPRAVVDEPAFNYGTRRDDETVNHQFVLRNEGTGVLNIQSVRASCGCTTTELPTNVLAPGEEVKIEAVTKLRGRQGSQRMSITVVTNDPERPTIRLMLEGEVLASIMMAPRNINFGQMEDNERREETVTIRSTKDDLTFTITSIELSGMDFVKHDVKEVEPGKVFEVVVRTAGDVPAGNHSARMLIRTDAREHAVLWLPISMQVVGAVQLMPPVINIRYTEAPDEVSQQQLRISSGRVQEFEILEVITPIDSIEATLTPAGSNQYTLHLANIPRNDVLEGRSVVLRTNIPDHEEIEIPFHIHRLRQPAPPR